MGGKAVRLIPVGFGIGREVGIASGQRGLRPARRGVVPIRPAIAGDGGDRPIAILVRHRVGGAGDVALRGQAPGLAAEGILQRTVLVRCEGHGVVGNRFARLRERHNTDAAQGQRSRVRACRKRCRSDGDERRLQQTDRFTVSSWQHDYPWVRPRAAMIAAAS